MSLTVAPIVLFVYNRPEHARQTLEALSRAELADVSKLIIFSDGAKSESDVEKVREVRRLIGSRAWCKEVEIRESETNKGLFDSIVGGVTEVVNAYGRIIVLEDDLVVHPMFLRYMNDALAFYEQSDKVFHVSGYSWPFSMKNNFFVRPTTCWGWATWKNRWAKLNTDCHQLIEGVRAKSVSVFNLYGAYDYFSHLLKNQDGRMKTWAVRWYASVFINDGLSLHPRESLVRNIGHDASGEHCKENIQLVNQELGNYFPKFPTKPMIKMKHELAIHRHLTKSFSMELFVKSFIL